MGRKSTAKRACRTKIRHETEESADQHAKQLCIDRDMPPGHWHTYKCVFCPGFHVGRLPAPKGSFPREPRDITLYNEIGRRTYHCGLQENHRSYETRLRFVKSLGVKAVWRGWKAKRTTPLP